MNDCERYEQMISALIDGELSPEEEADVRAHMRSCPDCAAMYEAFAAVGAAIGAQDVPDTLHEGIMAKVRTAEKAKKTQNTIIRLRPILAAAACFVFVVGTLFALRNSIGFGRSMRKSAADAPMAPDVGVLYTAGESFAASTTEEADMAIPEDAGILESKIEATGAPMPDAYAANAAADSLEMPQETAKAGMNQTEQEAETPKASADRGTAGSTAADRDVIETGKIVSYADADAVIQASALIVRVEKTGEAQVNNGAGDRYTLSDVRVEEVIRSAGAEVAAGDAIQVRESQWTDAESGTEHHLAGYLKMETGKQYILFLGRNESQDNYYPLGVISGKLPLDPQEPLFLGGDTYRDVSAILNELRDRYCPQTDG